MFVSGSWTVDVIAGVALLFALLYYYLTATHNHWKKKNVPYIQPTFPFGNVGKLITNEISFMDQMNQFYEEFKEHGYGGLYNLQNPALLVTKPDLIKQIITKDFSRFHDRGIPYDEQNDPLSDNLFNVTGDRWKILRAKLSPTFTSGKIKVMFPLIQECANEFKGCIRTEMRKGAGSIEIKDLLIRFTTDVIGTCAFGIQCNSLKNPDAEFFQISRTIFKESFLNTIRAVLITIMPKLASIFTMSRVFPKLANFFTQLMDRTVRFRRENNVERNDFVQLMMKLVDEDPKAFSQDIMTAQAFLFFLAGLDNVALNIGFCLHAMAVDPDLQEKVVQEIRTVLEDFDGKMCYEALGKMDLVSRVIDEGLRRYTPAPILLRSQTEDSYTLPDTDVVIDKGTPIWIPTQCIHLDEEIYPNPTKFDPDRFTEKEKAKRHPYTYIPFGEGPRFCIASRFALLEMRLCFAELIREFEFSVGPNTDVFLELEKKAATPIPKNGFWLRVTERHHN